MERNTETSLRYDLTRGAITALFSGKDVKDAILQYLGIKEIENFQKDLPKDETAPCRVILSDGEFSNSFFLLNSSSSLLILRGHLAMNYIIKILEYHWLEGSSKIVMIDKLEVLQKGDQLGRIGKPVDYSPFKNLTTPPPSPAKDQEMTPRNLFESPSKIASVNPYINTNLKVKVPKDPKLINYDNVNGKGQLLTVIFEDKSGRIKAVAYDENATYFKELIHKGAIFNFSNARVRNSEKKYLHVDHPFELVLNKNITRYSICNEDSSILDKIHNFQNLKDLSNSSDNFADFFGVCIKFVKGKYFNKKKQEEADKSYLYIIDETKTIIKMFFWNGEATNFDENIAKENSVLEVTMGRIDKYNGDNEITVVDGTVLKINPDVARTKELLDWFKIAKYDPDIRSRINHNKNLYTIGEIVRNNLRGTVFCYATVHNLQTEFILYKGCGICSKKLREDYESLFCDKCGKSVHTAGYSYCLKIGLNDDGLIKATIFGDLAEKFLGTKASVLAQLREENNSKFLEVLKRNSYKRYKFKLQISSNFFMDVVSPNYVVVSMEPVDYKQRCEELMTDIKKIQGV